MVNSILLFNSPYWYSPEIARILNEGFISIKVDREERPDIDRQYMLFVQATTGSGGWPMTVFLTPEKLWPFFGGTYFPPRDRYGQPGFGTLLTFIKARWTSSRSSIIADANDIMKELVKVTATPGSRQHQNQQNSNFNVTQALNKAFHHYEKSFDSRYGGFSKAPKFPCPVNLNFLLSYAYYQRWLVWKGKVVAKDVVSESLKKAEIAQNMAEFTLKAMARGGMYDHIGKGFHRYSTDKEFHVPQ